MPDASESRALDRINEQISALQFALMGLISLRTGEEIDADWADLNILKIEARKRDLLNELRTIILTNTVSNPPTATQVTELRNRVTALRNRNVTATAIQAIISDAFVVAAAATQQA